MTALVARCKVGGGAQQPSGFNNSVRRVVLYARGTRWDAEDRTCGAMQGGGWRATAIRFQQFGAEGSPLRARDAMGRRRPHVWRDARWGVARNSHPVSTIRCGG